MHVCGGIRILVRIKEKYFIINILDLVREWKGKWFYIVDQPLLDQQYGLPPYSKGPALKRTS